MASRQVRQQLIEDYRETLSKSPKWIPAIFKLFLTLPDHIVLNTPFLYFILGAGTPPFKMGRMTANYGLPEVEGQKCSNCIHAYLNVVNDKYICSQIRGAIEPKMWCKLWEGSPNTDATNRRSSVSGKKVDCGNDCEASMQSGQSKAQACCDDCGTMCGDQPKEAAETGGQSATTDVINNPPRTGRIFGRRYTQLGDDVREMQHMDLD